jgi:hypothetical protein
MNEPDSDDQIDEAPVPENVPVVKPKISWI